jgi:hypothetical protein
MWHVAQALIRERIEWEKTADGFWEIQIREHTCRLVRQGDGRFFFHIGEDQPRTFASILDLPTSWKIPDVFEEIEND